MKTSVRNRLHNKTIKLE